jgi:hypothetical protein
MRFAFYTLSIFAAVLLLSALPASADTTSQVICGSVGSAGNGNVAFTSAASGTGGSALTSGGIGIITCSGFLVPVGQTLTGLTVVVTDDATTPLNSNSQITWIWTYSGEPLTPTPSATNMEDGNDGGSFDACTGIGTLVCGEDENFTTNSTYANGQTTGNFTFSVAPSVTGAGGAGLGATGSDSASVSIDFTYVTTGGTAAPEPGTLMLFGSGLLGLVSALRRKRSA